MFHDRDNSQITAECCEFTLTVNRYTLHNKYHIDFLSQSNFCDSLCQSSWHMLTQLNRTNRINIGVYCRWQHIRCSKTVHTTGTDKQYMSLYLMNA